MQFEFKREKFKDAMHYAIARAGAHDGFGAIKLYKILWFSDARMFQTRGKPITGADYVRRQFGPVPQLALPIRSELESEGRIKVWKSTLGKVEQWCFRSLAPPNMSRFSNEERQTLDYWIKHIDEDHTGTSISDESHDYGWEIAKMGEILPMHAFLAERLREANDAELEWARGRVKQLGLR